MKNFCLPKTSLRNGVWLESDYTVPQEKLFGIFLLIRILRRTAASYPSGKAEYTEGKDVGDRDSRSDRRRSQQTDDRSDKRAGYGNAGGTDHDSFKGSEHAHCRKSREGYKRGYQKRADHVHRCDYHDTGYYGDKRVVKARVCPGRGGEALVKGDGEYSVIKKYEHGEHRYCQYSADNNVGSFYTEYACRAEKRGAGVSAYI